jgi:sorting nexin-1/2
MHFSKSAAMLGNAEEHTALSRALSQLAETEERIEIIQRDQADHDYYLMAELLKDYISLLSSVKVSFRKQMKI